MNRRVAVVLGLALSMAGMIGCGSGPSDTAPREATTGDWPTFRGLNASGVADGQNLPDTWDGTTGENIAWKTPIPGLAHSSPVIWGDRIFVTSAVSSGDPDATFKHGLYGDGDASEDRSVHRFVVMALDKQTGEIVWETTAKEGVPIEKRHIKSTYANATPVTDGRIVVAWFGSEGVFALDMDGNVLWNTDVGILNVGAYDAPEYEWGSASSPIIYGDLVIIQADTQAESFLMGIDKHTGETVWKTLRDELPSWGTPTVHPGAAASSTGPELVTNGSNFIRGYDPATGEERWQLGGSSKITAPTPIFDGDLIIVASGRRPEAPIFAIRAGATGDITLQDGATSSDAIAWSKVRRGSYMPTPIIYDGHLFVLANQGILDCYDLATGEEKFRERIPHAGGGFSGSPVAADGKLYLPGEDGDIFVVRAAETFEVVATNPIGELVMATPALSEGMLFVRAERHLFAIGQP